MNRKKQKEEQKERRRNVQLTMSGSAAMPLSRKILSPAGVVDALAASTRKRHPRVLAVSALTTEGTAAGTSTSQGSSKIGRASCRERV